MKLSLTRRQPPGGPPGQKFLPLSLWSIEASAYYSCDEVAYSCFDKLKGILGRATRSRVLDNEHDDRSTQPQEIQQSEVQTV